MILIAHRGNIKERNPGLENTPAYIEEALNAGFDVEIDVWRKPGGFFLGHDAPEIPVEMPFLSQKKLWIHAKNIGALMLLKNSSNCFFHNADDCTITSLSYVWVYPGKPLAPGCVAVLPETVNYSNDDLKQCCAICSDNPTLYLNLC